MYRRAVTTILLLILSCTSLAWGSPPEDYLIPGREKLFNGTLSGVREAYQIFTNGIEDQDCINNKELRFFHAAAGTVVLVCTDDGIPINSFFELLRAFGIEVLGDNWHQLAVYHPVNEHDAYEIPPDAPDAEGVRAIIDTMIPRIDLLIYDLSFINPSDPFTILLSPDETRVFFDPASPGLQYDLEVDYGEVLLLKGLLIGLMAQLQAKSAYDLYVDPDNNLVEKLHNNAFNINTDLLDLYPEILTVAPTDNNPEIGKDILAQARQDLIAAIDYYFEAVDYIRSENVPAGTDPQENELLYIDPDAEPDFQLVEDRLTTLRDSLANDTVGTYPWETTRTYNIKNVGGTPIGELVILYDIMGLEVTQGYKRGNLTFIDGVTPTPWVVNWFGREDANLFWFNVEYNDNGQWRQGFLEGTLSEDRSSITNATFQYWGQESGILSNLSGQLLSTQIVDAKLDLNPIYGSSTRYPNPVNPRHLLPKFDQWNGFLPGTMGHGLGNDPTLGGILPDMSQYDWQLLGDALQPGGLLVVSSRPITVDGSMSDWTSSEVVFEDIKGDTLYEKDSDPVSGVDIEKFYMAYDAQNLYGAFTLYDNISSSNDYWYNIYLSYSPDDESALGAIWLQIHVSGGSVTSSLKRKDNPHGYPEWVSVSGSAASAGQNVVEFKIPLANIPGGLPGRFILLTSYGRDSISYEDDGEWNGTHMKIEGLGTNELGTISGTVSYEDFSGAPIFVQAYTDPWDPEGSIIASTMINAPGPYTLHGIGIGWKGYVRAFTSLFGFNIFDIDALTIEASTSVSLEGPELTDVNLILGKPTTLPYGTWVQGQIDPNTNEDWYAFEAQQGKVYALDLDRGTSQYACMTLYGRDGHTELEGRYWGRWQHIDWTCPETGTYYIRVSHGYQPDSGTYQLRIALQDSMPSGYEVWGGDTIYYDQPNWWEYYYNIDKQDYVKLGESTGGSATFDGNYTFYVIATHEPIPIDSVNGPNAHYYLGNPLSGNTLSQWNITGAPDNQYAIVGGDWYSGGMNGTFEGFVIINNIGNWDSLTVTTADTGSISGKVVKHEDDSGLENVRVELYTGDDENIADKDAWNKQAEVYTDSNGEYRFDFLPQRRYRIRIPDQEVLGEHFFEANFYNVQVNAGAVTPNINPRLREAGLIYGYVEAIDGKRIPDAWVIAQAAWTEEGHGWHNAWTDETGKYELWVAPSPGKFYPVWVREASLGGTNYASKWDGDFYKATLDVDTKVPDFMLVPGGTVTGRVVNESGEGIEGVYLEVEWSQGGEDIGPDAETDSNGDFELRGCVPGINYICLDNSWREIEQGGVKYMVGEVCTGPVDVTAGETVPVGTFTIYKAGMITGTVTDESGNPVVDAEVELEGKDINGNWADRDEVVTGAFGQFTIDYIAPGTYTLSCRKAGFLTTFETGININRGQHVDHDMVMKSLNEGATISGRITNYADIASYDSGGILLPSYDDSDYDDYGYPEFGLVAMSMERDYTENDLLNIDNLFVGFADQEEIDDGYGDYFEHDPDETEGNYEIVLPSGDVAMFLYTSPAELMGEVGCLILHDWKRFNLAKGEVRDNLNFTAAITDTGTLEGNIVVPDGYDYYLPEEWCVIYASALDSNNNVINAMLADALAFPGWTTTYKFRNLPTGNYMLKAYARNLPSVTIPLVTVNSGITTQDIDFTGTPTGMLTGHITDGISDVKNAVVTIVENGRQAVTDDLGDYIFAGVNTGTYTVTVTALGYADAQDTIIIETGSNALDFTLNSNVGSISGTVKDTLENNINGATVLAYNETNDTHKTTETVGGAFSITGLTPGEYILAVDTEDYGVVVYPEGSGRITLAAKQDIAGINIIVGTPEPPLFTVTSSVSQNGGTVLSIEFYSDKPLAADPVVTIKEENNVSGALSSTISNDALNRFNTTYTYTASSPDAMVLIGIEGTSTQGILGSRTFTFELGKDLVTTSSTNVTNATGGSTSIMGTQDNTNIYVPPFAMTEDSAGVTQALVLTIERYGDPGDAVTGTSDSTVSAVYDFKFDEVSDVNIVHNFTVTMSFQLPAGMTQQEFVDSLEIRYFDADEQKWVTDDEHITNVRINWLNWTIMFEVSHLTRFAAFVPGEGIIGDFCGPPGSPEPDGYVDYWDLLYFAQRWHSSPSDTNWDPRCDLDKEDNYVDYWDLLVFAQNWHTGEPP